MIQTHQLSYFKALRSSFVLIFLATLTYRIFDQYLTKQIETIIRSNEGISSIVWLWASLSLLSAILFPVIITMLCAYALKNNSTKKISLFFSHFLELSILETIRAWGMSFLWGLLLIIPGLIKMSYYYLTIFIVLFNPDYALGKTDALKKSEEISKTKWFKLNLIVFIFYALIPMLASLLFDEYTIFEKNPITAICYTIFDAALTLFFNYLIMKLFLESICPITKGEPNVVNV